MPKSDNKHAINLYESIDRHIGHAAAEDFIEKLPLSKSADYNRKFKWANDVCAYLESQFKEDEIRKIRMDCSCDPGNKAENVKKMYEASADYNEFCEKFNKEYTPSNSLSHDGIVLYFSYPTCYCSCIKRGDGNVTKSWCICTIGYTKRLFSYALSREIDVELLESVKTGGTKCLMKIT
ncbi:MAG: DUF6144 family protein [Eubacteriales bacterium]|nr:DUF6144 family protein [Ruminiclostridium sp.]MDD4494978.1 DUF6144 family protein [Eubacteriales bacterium]